MSLLKTALKANNTAVAAAGDSDGNAFTKHIWETDVTHILNESIRDTSAYESTELDLSDWGVVSLRVGNTLKDSEDHYVTCTMKLQFDSFGESYNTKYASGDDITIPIPYGYIFITPDDYPLFNYLASMKLQVTASSTPASGKVSIKAVTKR